MSYTVEALFGLIIWSIVLVTIMFIVRMIAVSKGKRINDFSITGDDLGGFGHRITRAYGNSIENLAISASLLLYAIATGQTAVTNVLAFWLLFARIAQSLVHIVSTSPGMVYLRATLFCAQIVIFLIWIWRFWHAA